MRFCFFSFFVIPVFATVNEPFRWELLSGYRNDRLHWHLETGGTGLLTTSELWRNVQFWENGVVLKTITRDLLFFLGGSYSALGKGGTVSERYATLSFTSDEPQFQFDQTQGWAADTSGYFGYAVNLTTDRTYKVILIPSFGYSAHFEHLRGRKGQPNPWVSANAIEATSYTMSSSLPGALHMTWYGVCLGGGFQIEPGRGIVFSGGYSYHWLNTRFKASYKYTLSLFNPDLFSEQNQVFSFQTKESGNLGQTGWGKIDFLLSPFWRCGVGAQIHYYSTALLETNLHQRSTSLIPSDPPTSNTLSQKLKIRWTSISGWLMISRDF